MSKELGELAQILGQANVLRLRILESKSQVGAKEHQISENEKSISRLEALKEANKTLTSDIAGMKARVADDEIKLSALFDILRDNGIPVSEKLQGTNIVNI